MLDLALDQRRQAIAKRHGRDNQLAVACLLRISGEVVEQLRRIGGDPRIRGEQPEIRIHLRGRAVVVARADVHVSLNRIAFLSDDEAQLAMCFQVQEPVHDVHAGLFQPRRPSDVAALVEPRLQLDEHRHLFAGLRGGHQPLHERRFVADAIKRHLDRDDMLVVDGCIEKRLERRKRVERMVEQRVAVLDVLEDAVRILAVPDRARHERRVLQLRPLDARQRHPVGEAEPRRRSQDDFALDLEVLDQNVEHARRHLGVDLQQRQRAVSNLAKSLVDRLEQVDRLLLLQHDVGFANHPEQVRIDDLDAWEELAEVQPNDVFEQCERQSAPAGQQGRNRARIAAARPALSRARSACGRPP